ncbi:ABC transporter permease [Mogibacterium sp. NSJ-24]|jgi:putative tryptophan/tyrosine transport system permease protein|uniref:ABC transporter permease n=1 Tax=Lentihominibacter hominis TaxID=2763645 RepID=A0A926E8N0_9FIRM|nr:ABC transporter permease [Lentihominibacter hominis]MBC8568420.1 ABC transporter permease [Lentihominibacter hominis]
MLIVTLLEALELGLIYSILALGVFLSFRTLNTPDLTVDGSIVTGAAVSAVMCTAASGMEPTAQTLMCILGLILAFVFGMGAGAITALLNTKLKIQSLLAGILVMLGIYSINLRIQGKANVNLNSTPTLYKTVENAMNGFRWSSIVFGLIIAAVVIFFMFAFLKTRKGFALRATGDNEEMVRAAGISSDNMKLLGLSVSNGLVGLAGGMLAQYQGYSDVGMGTGMVVIGLASVIIGEVLFGTGGLLRRLIAVALGAVVYRMVIGVALYLGMPPTDLKLVSAVIVTIALAMGMLGENFSLRKKRSKAGERNA